MSFMQIMQTAGTENRTKIQIASSHIISLNVLFRSWPNILSIFLRSIARSDVYTMLWNGIVFTAWTGMALTAWNGIALQRVSMPTTAYCGCIPASFKFSDYELWSFKCRSNVSVRNLHVSLLYRKVLIDEHTVTQPCKIYNTHNS